MGFDNMQIFVAMPLGEKEIDRIRSEIRKAVGRAGFECRFPDEIAGHGMIISDVMDEIARSSAVIVEISDRNPNVIWECGWASALGKPIFPITKNRESFFFDTQHNRTIVYSSNKLEETLGQTLTIWCESLYRSGADFPPVQLIHSKTYSGSSSAIFGLNSLTNTDFGFFELIGKARRHFFAAAQNHHFLVNNIDRLKKALLSFFSQPGAEKRFDMLMCDPNCTFGVETWKVLSLPEYENHLRQSSEALDAVSSWAKSEPIIGDRFRLKKVPMVPVSINFIDPDEHNGLLTMTPTFLKSENMGRHCMVISKINNGHIFMQYWSWASNLFTLYG
jgi:nucleoside 2-deoxyribosyltransferase